MRQSQGYHPESVIGTAALPSEQTFVAGYCPAASLMSTSPFLSNRSIQISLTRSGKTSAFQDISNDNNSCRTFVPPMRRALAGASLIVPKYALGKAQDDGMCFAALT